MPDLDSVLLVAVDGTSLRAWVKEREATLVAAENEMFRAARDRATTAEERAYWDDLLALRSTNAASRRPTGTP